MEYFRIEDRFWGSIPTFLLLGGASMVVAAGFFRLRRKSSLVGAGLLSVGFLLWGIYLTAYPWLKGSRELLAAAFFVSAALQLVIALSMIVLVLEEGQRLGHSAREDAESALVEKESLAGRASFAEERYRALFQQSNDGILLVSAMDLRILDWNPAGQQLLGVYTRSDEPRYIHDFIPLPNGEKGCALVRCDQPITAGDGPPAGWEDSFGESDRGGDRFGGEENLSSRRARIDGAGAPGATIARSGKTFRARTVGFGHRPRSQQSARHHGGAFGVDSGAPGVR